MSAPAKPKRPRLTLTLAVKRHIIMAALEGAGLDRSTSVDVAFYVAKMPINGIHNLDLMTTAIREAIPRARAQHHALLMRDRAPSPRPRLRLLHGGKGAP